MTPDAQLRLAQVALDEGLIDGATCAQICFAAGKTGLSIGLLLRQRGLVDDASLARLESIAHRPVDPSQETLGFGDLSPNDSMARATQVLGELNTMGLPTERFEARYALGQEIGRGGVGRVLTAQDRLTGRTVALKMLRNPTKVDTRQRHRFIAEAQTTAQLEHPNVVPVYDLGTLPDESPCFSMKWVRGRSLKQLLEALEADQDPELAKEYGRVRLLQIYAQVCMAVDFAHSKGVIHRDLKPENIMLGDYGEVLLMDWGIAKTQRSTEPTPDGLDPVLISRSEQPIVTMDGSVVGTPGYMAPEQAMGTNHAIDQRSDVWSLGAILYELLTGSRPFVGRTPLATLMATLSGPVVPPSVRAPNRQISPDLEAICMRALQPQRDDRYASARDLYDDIQSSLAGTQERRRREAEALHLVDEGDESLWYMRMLRDEAKELDARLGAEAALTGHEAIEIKRERWALEDRRVQVEEELSRAFVWAESKFLRATELIPNQSDARRRLADMHWERYREARRRHDDRTATDHLKAVGRYNDRRYDTRLAGQVPLHVTTEPPGAKVHLYVYVERDRILVPSTPRDLGLTPVETQIPTGRQLLKIESPGRPPIWFPLMAWQGDELRCEVPMVTEEQLGADFVFVPGGEFLRGNDPAAVLAAPTKMVDLTHFAIGRLPITCAEYADFLNDLPEDARAQHSRWLRTALEPGGVWVFPMADRDGDLWMADWPICLVTYADAEAYAAWRAQRDGALYRLPTPDEWEKAARGTDGRRFPWGDHFDPTFCVMRDSAQGPLLPQPVGACTLDASPYGVLDMAGGIREWVNGWFQDGMRLIRGGAWNHHAFLCHAASRYGANPTRGQTSIGFRLVKVIDF